MALEKIATSNNEQNEAPKNAQLEKVEDSIDYEKNNVDVAKLQEFKKMTDDIKKYGWEYKKEYRNIMRNIIKPFERKFKKIIDENKESRDFNSMSDEELDNAANARMEGQPKKLEWQQELFKKITNGGLTDEVQQLYEIVNNNMVDVQSFWQKVTSKGTIPQIAEDSRDAIELSSGTELDPAPNQWGNWNEWNDAPSTWGEWDSGSQWWREW